MKKCVKYLALLLILLTLSGCTIVRINADDIDTIVNVVLSKNNTLYNQVGKGYKYYIPRGVNYIDTVDFNEKLYSEGNYYYLYIDAVSYYNETEPIYTYNPDIYYSREFVINDKKGYLEITKTNNDKYLINFVYNYARIQALVKEEEINKVVLNSSYILSTVKFNPNVIKLMLNEEYFTNKEERYTVFEKKNDNNNFLQYIEDEETNNMETDSGENMPLETSSEEENNQETQEEKTE